MSKEERKQLQDEMNRELKNIREKHTSARSSLIFLMAVWVLARVIMLVIEYMTLNRFNLEMKTFWTNLVIMVVCLLFSYMVINGNKGAAILPILGGAMTLVGAFREFNSIGGADGLFFMPLMVKVYIYGLIAVGIVQILIMVVVMLRKLHKPYFQEIAEKQAYYNKLLLGQGGRR